MNSENKPTASAVPPPVSDVQEMSQADVIDALTERLGHLEAMLLLTCGAPFETFCRTTPESQERYLHACWIAAEDCREYALLLRS